MQEMICLEYVDLTLNNGNNIILILTLDYRVLASKQIQFVEFVIN